MWPSEHEKHQYDPRYDRLLTKASPEIMQQVDQCLEARALDQACALLEGFIQAKRFGSDICLALLTHITHQAYLRRREAAEVLPRITAIALSLIPDLTEDATLTSNRLIRKLRWHEAWPAAETLTDALSRNPRLHAHHWRNERLMIALDQGKSDEAEALLAQLPVDQYPSLDYHLFQSKQPPAKDHAPWQETITDAPDLAKGLRQNGFLLLKNVVPQSLRDQWKHPQTEGRALTEEERHLLDQWLRCHILGHMLQTVLNTWFIYPESYYKVSGGKNLLPMHQDGRTTNEIRDYLTFWIPLTPCGQDAPGLTLYPRRLTTFFPLGKHRPLGPNQVDYPWRADIHLLDTTHRVAPSFQPGDLLIFDKYLLHATQSLEKPTATRVSIDARIYSRTGIS